MSSERLVGGCERLPLAFLVAAQVPAQHDRGFQPAISITSLSLIPLAQGDTGERAPQVVTNTYGGLDSPTRRCFTFPLHYAGPEQVAPAGTFRADLLKSRGSPDVFFAAGSVSDRRALYGRVDSLRVRRHPPAIGGKRQWGFHYPLGIARYTPLRPAGFTI